MATVTDDNVIIIRKGDTESLDISAKVGTQQHSFSVGDVLTLTVRELPVSTSTVVLTASTTVTTAGTVQTITIPATVTAAAAVGTYSCDIQLTSDGTVKTIFPIVDADDPKNRETKNWKNFIIEAEVTA